jgi:hypothetical protein
VEGVRNQGDSEVNLLESLVQSSGIVHIEGDSLGVGEAFAELLGALKGSAGCKSQKRNVLSVYANQIFVMQMRCPGYIHPASCHWSSGDHERHMQPSSKKKGLY